MKALVDTATDAFLPTETKRCGLRYSSLTAETEHRQLPVDAAAVAAAVLQPGALPVRNIVLQANAAIHYRKVQSFTHQRRKRAENSPRS